MKMLSEIGLCMILNASVALSPMASPAPLFETSLRGQLSADAGAARYEGEWTMNGSLRYMPQLIVSHTLGPGREVDLEATAYLSGSAGSEEDPETDLTLHRLKLRLATQRTETRLGLQQINFGSAYLLRPLQWFDILDPRDPLMYTEGVYSLSAKYTGGSNASLWLWSLYGNDDTKGIDIYPSVKDEPEFGGRAQVPVPRGEMALTYHWRTVAGPAPLIGDYEEHRLGLDGRWDVTIGLWFEAAVTRSMSDAIPLEWSRLATIGADYTVPLGNGIHVLVESMVVSASEEPLDWSGDSWVSALMIGYSTGYRDRLTMIVYQDWDADEWTVHAAWERSWDHIIMNVSVYRFPKSVSTGGFRETLACADPGARVMLILNH